MKLKVLGNSSLGNGYLLEKDREVLMIKSEMRFAEVNKVFGFNVGKVAASFHTLTMTTLSISRML